MIQGTSNHNLFSILEHLYTHIMQVLVQMRLDSYRRADSSEGVIADFIKYINRMPPLANDDSNTHYDIPAVPPARTGYQHKYPPYHKTGSFPAESNSLRDAFIKRNEQSVLRDRLGRKLKISTWEHIHTSIRYARKGNRQSAKLHADIAASAIKEAAHYMPKEEYQTFIAEVNKEVASLDV